MAELSPGMQYVLFLLSVTITTLGLIALGGVLKVFFKKKHASIRKKIALFPVFVGGIFAMGWVTTHIQSGIFDYLSVHAARSIPALSLAVLVAWFLYDWVFWRKS